MWKVDGKGLIIIATIILFTKGPKVLFEHIKTLFFAVIEIFLSLIYSFFEIFREESLVILLGPTLTFLIVGNIIFHFDIPRGKLGSSIGKILFFVIGSIISFVLSIVGIIIFS